VDYILRLTQRRPASAPMEVGRTRGSSTLENVAEKTWMSGFDGTCLGSHPS